MLKLGIIGYGVRTAYVWQGTMKPIGGVELCAIADPKWEQIKEKSGHELPNCNFYATAEEMLENELFLCYSIKRCFYISSKKQGKVTRKQSGYWTSSVRTSPVYSRWHSAIPAEIWPVLQI